MSSIHNFFTIYGATITAPSIPSPPDPDPPVQEPTGVSPIPEPTENTILYYVSDSDGSDAFDGLTISTPKKTLSAGLTLLNIINGDYRLLLKRGDTFFKQNFDKPTKVGASGEAPMVIAAYGTGNKPIVTADSGTNIMSLTGGGGAPSIYSDWAVADIDFYQSLRDLSSPDYVAGATVGGFVCLRGMENFTLYNCEFRFCNVGASIQDFDDAGFDNVLIRDCNFVDSWAEDPVHSQGMFIEGGTGIITTFDIEGCIFDHCGWNDAAPNGEKTGFNHSLYIQSDPSLAVGDVTVSGCAFIRSSSNGIQLRPGGLLTDCLFLENPIAALVGAGDVPVPGGISGTFINNVIMETSTIDGATRGWGIDIGNASGVNITNNIVANIVNPSGSPFAYWDTTGVTYSGNKTYDWVSDPPHASEHSVNDGPFNDPTRTVASFDGVAGGPGTKESFYSNFRVRASGYHIQTVLNYLRAGFEAP